MNTKILLAALLSSSLVAVNVTACTHTQTEGAGIGATAGGFRLGLFDKTPELKEGDAAPDFALKADDGRTVKLADYKNRTIVMYFYPKDETPGCTKEACAFRDSFAEYKKAGIEVLGVSVDSVESHQAFKKNQRLTFTLLSDESKEASKAYGVLSSAGYSKRVTFIIKDGVIKKIYPQVSPAEHAAEVLADARAL